MGNVLSVALLEVLLIAVICGVIFLVAGKIFKVLNSLNSSIVQQYEKISQEDDETHIIPVDIQMMNMSRKNLEVGDIKWSSDLTLYLNESMVVIHNPDPSELLVTFIRDKAGLKGTKLGCEEGGCGACTVVLTKGETSMSVNSCLRPLCVNDGMAITTVEGIGSIRNGLSVEQKALVENNATQCGFCAPGWVTNMHALNESKVALNGKEIENYFDGNICRCTGYKSILHAFKSGSSVCSPAEIKACSHHGTESCTGERATCVHHHGDTELEDFGVEKGESKGGKKKSIPLGNKRNRIFASTYELKPLYFFSPSTGKKWFRPLTLEQLSAVLRSCNVDQQSTVQLVAGNTSIGVTKYLNNTAPHNTADEYNVYVDVNQIPEMSSSMYVDNTLTVGSAVTITTMIELLKQYSDSSTASNSSFVADGVNHRDIFSVTSNHLGYIANTQVRNAGSWAGNLMMYYRYPTQFPSDAVIALTTANAVLQLSSKNGVLFSISMAQFLERSVDLNDGSFIISVSISKSKSTARDMVISETYKVAQRAKNAHAHVNCGFSAHLIEHTMQSPTGPTCRSARVVIGGASNYIFVAKKTESVLKNAVICSNTLQLAVEALRADLAEVGASTAYGSAEFRESVMFSNMYRFFIRCLSNHLEQVPYLRSAISPWVKPESRGTELFVEYSETAPVGKAIPKLESQCQVTGEAIYPSDESIPSQGVHACMVYGTRCAVRLAGIDASAALALPGVVTFYAAVDIPGKNAVFGGQKLFIEIGQEVPHVGAPIGVIVATTDAIATQASNLIAVTYEDMGLTPIGTIDTAIVKESFYPMLPIPTVTIIEAGDAESAMNSAFKRVKGTTYAGGQSHIYLETNSAYVVPKEGEVFEITCGTQAPSMYQSSIAAVIDVPSNKLSVKCSRTGGGFGGKISGGIPVAAAATLIASKLKRPVRIFNSRTQDMNMSGGREGYVFDYEVGFQEDGTIVALILNVYMDGGSDCVEALGGLYMGMNWADNAYYFPNYTAKAIVCKTNTNPRCSMRAPGVVQFCLATEAVVERVAVELNKNIYEVQTINFIKNGETTIVGQTIKDCTLDIVWNKLFQRSHFSERLNLVNKFNSLNLWRKRGISITPVKYGMGWAGYDQGCMVSVIKSDGSITVSHTGVELGQGINTKVAQSVAYSLGVDISLIRVVTTSTEKMANGGVTGGSGTSEVCCQAALNACQVLNDRLQPFRDANPKFSWSQLISSVSSDVSLNVEGWYSPKNNPNGEQFQYFVYAACVSEVELDVLSGAVHVLASEIVYDCGKSLNPAVDIGQIEGGYVMGLGYLLQERLEYEDNTGVLLTTGTWEYKPPMVADIPSLFNVTLIKNAENKDGILGSKAVGEPSFILSNSVFFATKYAIMSSRLDAGMTGYVDMEAPLTVDVRHNACGVSTDRFILPF